MIDQGDDVQGDDDQGDDDLGDDDLGDDGLGDDDQGDDDRIHVYLEPPGRLLPSLPVHLSQAERGARH